MNKFYYLLVLLIVLAIALISRWLLTTVEAPPGRVAPEERHDPDYYVEKFKLTMYQPDGSPAYFLDADYMNHYPDDDTMTLQHLHLEYYGDTKQTWIATANTATAYKNTEVMQLTGDVQIHSQAPQPYQAITIKTQTLHLDIPKKYASTRDEVQITVGDSHIRAIGMDVDLANSHMTLLSHARGVYVPK